ncbi:MAG TPA: hypothetical protein VGE65_07855 [Sphingobium sp.]
MFKAPLIVLAATGLVLWAGPALAKAEKSDEPTTRMTVKQKDGQTLYCVRNEAKTGQLMGNNVCKSREEWAEAGLDIPANSRSAGNEGAKSAGTARLNP